MDKNKLAVDTYSLLARKYDNDFGSDYSDAPYIDKFLESLNGKDVLDIGCGPGGLTNYMSERGFNVMGIDLSDEMLKIAKAKYKNITFKKMDMREIAIDKKFDGISLLYSLFHLTKKEVEAVLLKYYNLLKPNGKMLITLEYGHGEKVIKEPMDQNLLMFVNYYDLEEITNVLQKHNFGVYYSAYKQVPEGDLSDKEIVILCEKLDLPV